MWGNIDKGHDSSDEEDYLFYPSTILEGKLYLSCASIAGKRELIERYGIKGIISMGSFNQHTTYTVHPDPMQYHFVFIEDHEDEPIHLEFKDCIKFINDIKGPVLVHCMAGISRSSTIIMAYLMSEKQMGLEEAYVFVKQKRRIVRPNSGFKRQLRQYELDLKDGGSGIN